MADAVHFATWDDGSVDSAGFSGFPTPFITGGASARAPNVVAYNKCIKWFWRARKITLSASVSVSAGADTASFPGGVLDKGAVDVALNNMTSEMDHVYRADFGPGLFASQQATSASSMTFEGTVNLAVFIDPSGGGTCPITYFDGTDHFPYLYISGNLAISDPGSGDNVQLTFSSDPADLVGGVTGSLTATFDGENITVYYHADVVGGASYTITSLDFTISSFWPYAAADASPIYNTSTGAQLQDPRN